MAKVAKSSVDYGNGMPRSHCSLCRHFQAPSGCEKVKGSIDPQAWCKLFARK